jgi:hypothetical protein
VSDSLHRAFTALQKARLVGYASACFWVLAVMLLIDGLQTLMRTDFNRIDLPLGEQVFMSGAMPLDAKTHSDLDVTIEGNDGLSFTPHTDFKGLWFGAHMWRATLDASNTTQTGEAVLTVLDMVPAKNKNTNATIMVQNPNQIFSITVWPSRKAMLASHYSLSRRLTGFSAFLWAPMSLACGLLLGVANLFLNSAAQNALTREGLFAVYGRRKMEAGYHAFFMPGVRSDLLAQQPMALLTPSGQEQGRGVLVECTRFKGTVFFPLDGVPPHFGWLLRYEPDAGVTVDSEKNISA